MRLRQSFGGRHIRLYWPPCLRPVSRNATTAISPAWASWVEVRHSGEAVMQAAPERAQKGAKEMKEKTTKKDKKKLKHGDEPRLSLAGGDLLVRPHQTRQPRGQ